jgi:putative flavoprotein involved in K+ transport
MTTSTTTPGGPGGAPDPRRQLLDTLAIAERRLVLAGISTPLLEAGDGPPVILLHGPAGNCLHWMRVIPELVTGHRVVVPDLPGHGESQVDGELDAERVLAWLDDLIAHTCGGRAALVGQVLGGAIAARFALGRPDRVSRLVLVDTFGLRDFQPASEMGGAAQAFFARPTAATHDELWRYCAHDLSGLRERMGSLWPPFEAYNIDRARTPSVMAASSWLLEEFGKAIPAPELARIAVPTSLVWGRHDLATPLSIAEAASRDHGWPLHVIERCNDDPPIEQPEALARVLDGILERRRASERRHATDSAGRGREQVHTLIIGAGQAGLATSYWLQKAGIAHLLVERRPSLGGAWHDRWDSFTLVAPNYTLRLPGLPYAGPDPDGFMPRDQVLRYVRDYGAFISAPVRLDTGIDRLSAANGHFEARSAHTTFHAENVVLATGAYPRPKLPVVARSLPDHIPQLHSNDYRRPGQLPDGAVLVVGSGQSGAQIAEDLMDAGREVHLAVSMCPGAPRRYRGRDCIWWLMQAYLHGAEVGVHFPTVGDLPTPAARFACNPIVSGKDGGHDLNLRRFVRRGAHLYGQLESISGATARFSGDLAERLRFADTKFDEEFRPLFDAYIAAAGIDAPPDDRPPPDDFEPATSTELDLDRAGVGSVVWATGYRLDFGWVDLPVLDQWGYPKHVRGVTTYPGLYAIGLPWLHSEPSSVFAGIGADAAHLAEHIARHRAPAGAGSVRQRGARR